MFGCLPVLFCNRGMAAAHPGTGPKCKDLCYEDVIELTKKNEIILIDVREPSEVKETGKLPGSVHIPRESQYLVSIMNL